MDNLVIKASAGSGKTYRLAGRFIDIIQSGAAPEEICALTFTRKAAGEMFDGIVARLVSEPTGEHLTFLRTILEHSTQLRIATLDSFASLLARSFATELGLPPHITLINNDSPEVLARNSEILSTLLRTNSSPHLYTDLIGLSRSKETDLYDKRPPSDALLLLVKTFELRYRNAPTQWGALEGIGNDPMILTDQTRQEMTQLCLNILPDTKPFAKLRATYRFLGNFTPPQIGSLSQFALSEKQQLAFDNVCQGVGTALEVGRSIIDLSTEQIAATQALFANYCHCTLWVLKKKTETLADFLSDYTRACDRYIRQTGVATFEDLTRLLSQHDRCLFSAYRSDATNNLAYINFRFDGMINHYLLDEFQDTSTQQWEMLKQLIDEIMDRTQDGRSLFYVGDLKQSIYGWRGGNAKLFDEIIERYSSTPKALTVEHLDESQRSAQPIIDTVNALCDLRNYTTLTNHPGLEQAVNKWCKTWEVHSVAKRNQRKQGVVEHILLTGATRETQIESFAQSVHAIIQSYYPSASKPRMAILLRGNKHAYALASALAEVDITASIEGQVDLVTYPFASVVSAALQVMSHPADTVAQGFLVLHGITPHHLDWLTLWQEEGYIALINHLGQRFFKRPSHPCDAIDVWEALIQLAQPFDVRKSSHASPSTYALETFKGALDAAKIDASDDTSLISIMTIHKSKGLTYDVVFVPYFETTRAKETFYPSALKRSKCLSDSAGRWHLLAPSEYAVIRSNRQLDEAYQQAISDFIYEELCAFYVAMTRPAHALYIFTADLDKIDGSAFTPANLIRAQLIDQERISGYLGTSSTLAFSRGNNQWYTQQTSEPPAPPLNPIIWQQDPIDDPIEMQNFRPSHQTNLQELWHAPPRTRYAMQFGAALHDLLAQIEWIDHIDIDQVIHDWQTSLQAPVSGQQSVVKAFKSLVCDSCRDLFTQPENSCKVWREVPFSIPMPDNVASQDESLQGRFDRVHIFDDHAVIYDFKSSREETILPAYEQQLAAYQHALGLITHLPIDRIKKVILFTRTGTCVTL